VGNACEDEGEAPTEALPIFLRGNASLGSAPPMPPSYAVGPAPSPSALPRHHSPASPARACGQSGAPARAGRGDRRDAKGLPYTEMKTPPRRLARAEHPPCGCGWGWREGRESWGTASPESWSAWTPRARILEMPLRKWSHERIVAAIRARQSMDLSVNCGRVKTEDIALYSAACYHLGSWRLALGAAGIPVPPIKRKWEKVELVQILRRLSRGGRFVGSGLLDRESARIGRSLRSAIRVQFGSLRAARAQLGLPSKRPPRIWTREAVLRAVRRLARGGRLRYSQVEKTNPRLLKAMKSTFGGWLAGLAAAGVDRGTKWMPADILRALRGAWAKREIRVNVLKERLGSGIYPAAVLAYGSWPAALNAAGVPAWAYATKMSSRRSFLKVLPRHQRDLRRM